ncbi:hypothetical protein [Neisseria elongata]
MRELNIFEMKLVSGGDGSGNGAKEHIINAGFYGSAAAGTVNTWHAAKGITGAIVTERTATAGLGGAVAYVSYQVGTAIYNNSRTVRETAIGMMESIDLRYFGGRIGQPDQSGNNYDGTDY